jgi:hypothetical protein
LSGAWSRPNLAQDVFAGVPREVQVHQDQIRNSGLGPNPLPADISERLASVRQMNQFKFEILFLQCPLQKKDV